MTQIKLFTNSSSGNLEEVVNEWLQENPNITIKDIKFNSVIGDFIYRNILIVYDGSLGIPTVKLG